MRNDWLFAAADFEFVSVEIFEEERVISRAVFGTNFRPFEISSADLADKIGDAINFFTCVCPKSDSRAVGFVLSIFGESEKFRRLVFADRVKRSPIRVGTLAGKSERRQNFSVKLSRRREVLHPQIDVIKATTLH